MAREKSARGESRQRGTAVRVRSRQRVGFLGRPPFAPLARAASALASDVALPPLRPSATAAGFLRGTEDKERFYAVHHAGVEAMHAEHGGGNAAKHVGQGTRLIERQGNRAGGVSRLRHIEITAKRLGYVKWGN